MDPSVGVAVDLASELADVVYAIELSPVNRFVFVSPSVEALVGYTPEEHYADPGLGMRLLDPRDVDALLGVAAAPVGATTEVRLRWIAKDGTRVLTEHHCRTVAEPDGRLMLYGAARDVTARVRLEVELREERDRYRLLSENSQDVVYRTGVDRTITWISPSVTRALGWQPDELVGRKVGSLVHPDDLQAIRARTQEILAAGGNTGEAEVRIATASGEWRWMRVVGRVVRDEDGIPIGGIDELRDMQGEMELRAELLRGLDQDSLTGLANRDAGLRRIREAIEIHDGGGWALLCAGIDGMTRVNQAFTHTAGDRVLAEMAERLVVAAGASDRVARVAGDEFVILLPHVGSPADAATEAERILAAMRGPLEMGPHRLEISGCIGVAMLDHQDAEELLRDATTAMRQASAHGADHWEFLDPAQSEHALRMLTVEAELRDGLAAQEIRAWFQPIVTLADGKVCGYEALARWVRADGSVVPPDDFLPTAARSDLIVRIDHEVLRQAFDALATLPDDYSVAVNISVRTLIRGDLCDVVQAEVSRTGVAPDRLHLEVTETALLNVTDTLLYTMRTLDAGGITWWVDDFGTGFSSVSHIRDLPVGGLKLDRSFTTDVHLAGRAAQLSSGLAGLAHGLDLLTVAEGVETAEQAAALLAQGWTRAQGWAYGRPAPLPAGPIST